MNPKDLEAAITRALEELKTCDPTSAAYWAGEVRRLSGALAAMYRARLIGVKLGEPIGVSHTARLLGRRYG